MATLCLCMGHVAIAISTSGTRPRYRETEGMEGYNMSMQLSRIWVNYERSMTDDGRNKSHSKISQHTWKG
jgi:hypothetical protein